MNWEGPLRADARLAARNAYKIRAALRNSINSDTMYEAYLSTQPNKSGNLAQDRARARAWAIMNVRLNLEAFKLILMRIWATGYLIGELAATEIMEEALQEQNKSATINKKEVDEPEPEAPRIGMNINWDTWEPGDRITASLLKPKKGLQRLLSNQNVRIKDMTSTTLNDLGNALGEAVAVGMSARQAAKHIRKTLAHPSRALMIAITESNRAMTFAAMDRYQDFGITQTRWLVFDPCDICAKNAGQIADMGTPFPSNDLRPPAHPNCRCTIAPVLPDFTLGKHLPGQHDQKTHAGGRVVISQQFQQEIDPEFRSGGKSVTKDESWALSGYRASGYERINKRLRGIEQNLDEVDKKIVDRDVKLIDQVIEKAPGAPEEFISYRGLQAAYADTINSLEPGQTFTDLGFSSTTLNLTTARNMGFWGRESTVVEIVNPVGTKGVMMEGFWPPTEDNRESEWLLPRKTTFKVLSKEKKDDIKFIKVRVQ